MQGWMTSLYRVNIWEGESDRRTYFKLYMKMEDNLVRVEILNFQLRLLVKDSSRMFKVEEGVS